MIGKLNILHGHEWRKGFSPANPAKWLLTQSGANAMCGHWHKTDETTNKDVEDGIKAAWTVGCMCNLHPKFMPLNNWNHGFAIVNLLKDDNFSVENKRIINGKIYS
jgi:hypothetical protein